MNILCIYTALISQFIEGFHPNLYLWQVHLKAILQSESEEIQIQITCMRN